MNLKAAFVLAAALFAASPALAFDDLDLEDMQATLDDMQMTHDIEQWQHDHPGQRLRVAPTPRQENTCLFGMLFHNNGVCFP
jgi:hypothetical protein